MYKFNVTDAWILAAIYLAGAKGKNTYADIIASLPNLGHPLPTHAQCKTAYDKFLYMSFIIAVGDKTSLTVVAEKIIIEVYVEDSMQWISAIEKQLAVYKLKSMCNRFEWTEQQYQHGIELLFAEKGGNDADKN